MPAHPNPPNQLETFYYLHNFHTMLNHVVTQYAALLSMEEHDFVTAFTALTQPEQALMVRLYCRRKTLFRSDKLSYPELPPANNLLDELQRTGFIKLNPDVASAELLGLPTCAEMRAWWKDYLPASGNSLRREELVAALQTLSNAEIYLTSPFTVIQVCDQTIVDRILLMFFAHPDQDLTAFVTTQLGHTLFEPYPLSLAERYFNSREEIDQAWQLKCLREFYYEIEDFDAGSAQYLLANLPAVSKDSPLKARHDRLCNRIGRQLERCNELTLAHSAYRRAWQPPARERTARVYFYQQQFQQALALCNEILEAPRSEAEQQFAEQFRERCRCKLGKPHQKQKRFQPTTIDVTLPVSAETVENLAGSHIQQTSRGICLYVENWLFNALFGLAFWEVIFAPIRGAFSQPFQHAPHDLYDADFCAKRRKQIEQVFDKLHLPNWPGEIIACRTEKYGISNPFVGWHEGGEEVLKLALDRIPNTDLSKIFRRMLGNLRDNCSGFPDLIHFPETGGYRLLEVKSPTDKVQAHQLRWMKYFASEQIPYALVQVSWES